jgi:uncharacterized membrane protein
MNVQPPLNVTQPSSTGLDAPVAAALSYLAGPFSAVVILLAERTNLFVRFHAWQSIIALGGLGLATVGFLVLAFLTLLLSPFLFRMFYMLAWVTALVWLVAWGFCLVKAFGGAWVKLPYAGGKAEERARLTTPRAS